MNVRPAVAILLSLLAPASATAGPPREDVLDASIRWLVKSQGSDGGWAEAQDGAPAPGEPGLTGLVLVTFLGNGYTNRGSTDVHRAVARGLEFLRAAEDGSGRFRHRDALVAGRDHALATLALTEGYGMTESPLWRGVATRAFAALPAATADPDVETAGWTLMALASARMIDRDAVSHGKTAVFEVPEAAFARLARFAEPPSGASVRARAVAALARIAFDPLDVAEARLRKLTRRLGREPLSWDPGHGTDDPEGALFTVTALRFASRDSDPWRTESSAAMRSHRAPSESPDAGSLDPADLPRWTGGRVRLTALSAAIEGMTWSFCYPPHVADAR